MNLVSKFIKLNVVWWRTYIFQYISSFPAYVIFFIGTQYQYNMLYPLLASHAVKVLNSHHVRTTVKFLLR